MALCSLCANNFEWYLHNYKYTATTTYSTRSAHTVTNDAVETESLRRVHWFAHVTAALSMRRMFAAVLVTDIECLECLCTYIITSYSQQIYTLWSYAHPPLNTQALLLFQSGSWCSTVSSQAHMKISWRCEIRTEMGSGPDSFWCSSVGQWILSPRTFLVLGCSGRAGKLPRRSSGPLSRHAPTAMLDPRASSVLPATLHHIVNQSWFLKYKKYANNYHSELLFKNTP